MSTTTCPSTNAGSYRVPPGLAVFLILACFLALLPVELRRCSMVSHQNGYPALFQESLWLGRGDCRLPYFLSPAWRWPRSLLRMAVCAFRLGAVGGAIVFGCSAQVSVLAALTQLNGHIAMAVFRVFSLCRSALLGELLPSPGPNS